MFQVGICAGEFGPRNGQATRANSRRNCKNSILRIDGRGDEGGNHQTQAETLHSTGSLY